MYHDLAAPRTEELPSERKAAVSSRLSLGYRFALGIPVLERFAFEDCLDRIDRGTAYLSYAFQELLDDHGIRMSTSRPGNCLDNARSPRASSKR
jgi:transposase InsO family protein